MFTSAWSACAFAWTFSLCENASTAARSAVSGLKRPRGDDPAGRRPSLSRCDLLLIKVLAPVVLIGGGRKLHSTRSARERRQVSLACASAVVDWWRMFFLGVADASASKK